MSPFAANGPQMRVRLVTVRLSSYCLSATSLVARVVVGLLIGAVALRACETATLYAIPQTDSPFSHGRSSLTDRKRGNITPLLPCGPGMIPSRDRSSQQGSSEA